MPTDAQTLLDSAISLGYDALNDRDLKECLLYAAQTGGGGGGVTSILAGTGISVDQPTGAVTVTATGGSGSVVQGVVDPVAPPSNPSQSVIYFNTATGVFWGWDVPNQVWI